MSDQDVTLGPGTDLVISLFAVSLLLVGALISLYVGSVDRLILSEERVDVLKTELDVRPDPEAVSADRKRMLAQIAALTDSNRRLVLDRKRLERRLAEKEKQLASLKVPRREQDEHKYRSKIDALAEDNMRLLATLRRLRKELKDNLLFEREIERLKTDLAQKNERVAQLIRDTGQRKREDESDEVIRFKHVEGNRFESGSYDINNVFRNGIENKVIPKVYRLAHRHGQSRVIVEVFGFTDGQHVKNKTGCTMDKKLIAYNRDKKDAFPKPCSNVDLGKLRADTVAKYVRDRLAQHGLSKVSVLGYSAGQTILSNDQLAELTDDKKEDIERRFVDVRFRLKH